MRFVKIGLYFCVIFSVASCTTPPPLDPLNRVSIQTVVDHINCEIKDAVNTLPANSPIRTWYTKYDLSLQVDANAGTSPNISVIRPYHSTAGMINLGAGFNLSGAATRIETVSVRAKLDQMQFLNCDPSSPPRTDLAGDLGIADWLDGVTKSHVSFPEASTSSAPTPTKGLEADTIGHTAQFVFTAGANVTPTFSLEKFKGPAASGTLASTSRTDTNKLVIAFSNQDPSKGQKADRALSIQHNQLIFQPSFLNPATGGAIPFF